MKKLYEFYWDYGRSGSLTGLFVADEQFVSSSIGKRVDFGDVLGKHSEVYGILEDHDFSVKSEDPTVVAVMEQVFGECDDNSFVTISGHVPYDYMEEELEEDEE